MLSLARVNNKTKRLHGKTRVHPVCHHNIHKMLLPMKISPLLPSGGESYLEMNETEQNRKFPVEESQIKFSMTSIDRAVQKRKTPIDKGTISILKFFQNCDPCCSSYKQEEAIRDVKASSSHGSLCLEPSQDELPKERLEETGTNTGRSSMAHIEQEREAWDYKVDEIDPSVVYELPPEIQEEVRAWLRPHKRANVVKRGSGIAYYFFPAKDR